MRGGAAPYAPPYSTSILSVAPRLSPPLSRRF